LEQTTRYKGNLTMKIVNDLITSYRTQIQKAKSTKST